MEQNKISVTLNFPGGPDVDLGPRKYGESVVIALIAPALPTTERLYKYVCIMHVCTVITYRKSMGQPGKVANPARGQLNREN